MKAIAGMVSNVMSARSARLLARLMTRGRERGDLPGWVLITVMTAALVAVLWGFLGQELETMLRDALNRAKGVTP
ncbi:MAG TPA: hypothetical protein VIL34_22145 [Actinopolymorphaceae bacterium]|jgi:hypothetical protein